MRENMERVMLSSVREGTCTMVILRMIWGTTFYMN